MKKRFAAIFVAIAMSLPLLVSAQVKLPAIIRDSMILQRDTKVKLWGWASPGEKVFVTFNQKKINCITNQSGNWTVTLPPTPAGGPYTLTFTGKTQIVLQNILFGDVWFCSGQSNMVHQMNIHDVRYAKEIAEANYPQIRQFWVPNTNNVSAAKDDLPGGNWQAAVGENVRPFSAVAYFFAKKIYEQYHIPIGIINASVGGTPIEAWISEMGLSHFTDINAVVQKNKDTAFINSFSRNAPAFRPRQTTDLGLTGNKKWHDTSYVPKNWKNINIPGYWEDQGLKDLNGVVWYRKEINIPSSFTNKEARMFMGRIVDADEVYINGKQVGNTTYQYPQRRYKIAPGILQTGKNIFVIRVTNTSGKGGFVSDKPYCIFSGSDTIDLKGTWQYKVGDVFQPAGRGFAGAAGFSFQNQPAALYNAMVAPVINYTIRGFCWYQGEANAGKANEYTYLLPALMKDWRTKWNQGDLPFINVQLPGFMDYNYLPAESDWALLREAQLKSLSVPNSALAVTIDLGEWNDIHPDNKKDVGERMALAALKISYQNNIVHSGPIYESSSIEDGKIIIHFSNAGSGLVTNDEEEPGDFAIAGADKKFVWARTKIQGNKVIAWNDKVTSPVYIRYAWADNPVHANLYNIEGLPASPFRTDQ